MFSQLLARREYTVHQSIWDLQSDSIKKKGPLVLQVQAGVMVSIWLGYSKQVYQRFVEIGLDSFQEVCNDTQCNGKGLEIWYWRDNLPRHK